MIDSECSEAIRRIRRQQSKTTALVSALFVTWLAWSFFSKRQIPFDREVWLSCPARGRLSQWYRMKDDLIRVLTQTPGLTDKRVIEMLGPPKICVRQDGEDSPSSHVISVEYALGREYYGPIPEARHNLKVKFRPDGSVLGAGLTSG